jgi:NADH dehydrogenase
MGEHVVIAGGGFGGYYCARVLEKRLPKDARITLVNDVNFMLYAPLLPGAAAGTLEPRHVVVPLREKLKRTELRLGWVTAGDPANNRLHVDLIAGHAVDLTYDHLVVALGSVTRTFPIPGLTDHAIGFKTIAEAIALRNRVVRFLETAEEIEDPVERKEYLNFVFVGGGYAGLEGVAELQDFADDALEYYPRCRETAMRWILVEAAPRIMPQIQERLANFTQKVLEKRGIEIYLNSQLTEITENSVKVSGEDAQTIPTRTVCWTAGVKASPVAARLGLPLEGGRISCTQEMRVNGYDNVWALGDCAAINDPARPGFPCPPTAQHAIRQGKLMGKNVAAALGHGAQVKPFTFKTLGAFADLGRHNAVANLMGVPVSGFPAWAVCRFYHLAWLPGFRRKVRLIGDWTVDFCFRRDIAELGQLGHPPSLEEHEPPLQEPDGLDTSGEASTSEIRARQQA